MKVFDTHPGTQQEVLTLAMPTDKTGEQSLDEIRDRFAGVINGLRNEDLNTQTIPGQEQIDITLEELAGNPHQVTLEETENARARFAAGVASIPFFADVIENPTKKSATRIGNTDTLQILSTGLTKDRYKTLTEPFKHRTTYGVELSTEIPADFNILDRKLAEEARNAQPGGVVMRGANVGSLALILAAPAFNENRKEQYFQITARNITHIDADSSETLPMIPAPEKRNAIHFVARSVIQGLSIRRGADTTAFNGESSETIAETLKESPELLAELLEDTLQVKEMKTEIARWALVKNGELDSEGRYHYDPNAKYKAFIGGREIASKVGHLYENDQLNREQAIRAYGLVDAKLPRSVEDLEWMREESLPSVNLDDVSRIKFGSEAIIEGYNAEQESAKTSNTTRLNGDHLTREDLETRISLLKAIGSVILPND